MICNLTMLYYFSLVKWMPSHQGMGHPQVADTGKQASRYQG
jgi:hypothetical protein